jgi:hypothetical protein
MKIQDDRSAEERITHPLAVVGTDTFLSGWGEATGGVSYAAWACQAKDVTEVRDWVKSRSDMIRVRVVSLNGYHPRGNGHLHIYCLLAEDNRIEGKEGS